MPLAKLPLTALTKWGVGLKRPEDVAVACDGRVFATHPAFGAREILPSGTLKSVGETVFRGWQTGLGWISMDVS